MPYMQIPNLVPAGEVTGHAHPKCYMAGTNNCSKGTSREHYVSDAILKRFDSLAVTGMPWQAKDQTDMLPAKALVANVLCERHNSALSPLDVFGSMAFDAITDASDYAVTQKYPGRIEHFFMSGEGLELWLFKLAAGIHFGGIAASDGAIVKDNYSFPVAELIDALTTGNLPPDANLWVAELPGVVQRQLIRVAPLIETSEKQHLGVEVHFGPLRLQTTLVDPPIALLHLANLRHRRRPHIIDFIGPARDARIVLSWKGQHPLGMNRLGVQVRP